MPTGRRCCGRRSRSAPVAMRKWRPEPGEFSVHEIICHCADSETNSHGRIRYVLAEDNATIIGYDPNVWAARRSTTRTTRWMRRC